MKPIPLILAATIALPAWGQTTALPYTAEQLVKWNEMSPNALLGSEEVLSASLAAITLLSAREAEAFARALANCVAIINPPENLRGSCAQSAEYFSIIYSGPRSPLGLLYDATRLARMGLYVTEKGSGTSADGVRLIERLARIEGRWKQAVRHRISDLDKEQR